MDARKKRDARLRRKAHIRKKVSGTAARPRLAVYRSNAQIYAQVIDDERGHTLVSASSLDTDVTSDGDGGTKTDVAKQVGELVAKRAKDAGIDTVVFDRGGFQFAGRVKALADAARDAGLRF